jgi:DNA-binding IscR family transcriptional regulator
VVNLMDDLRALESCIMGEAECSDETACPLHSIWGPMRERFVASLKTSTLRDLGEFQELRPESGRLQAVKQKAGESTRQKPVRPL